MPGIENNLNVERCPHCNVANPNIFLQHRLDTNTYNNVNQRFWGIYACKSCGGVVTVAAKKNHLQQLQIIEIFPSPVNVDDCLPDRAKAYLEQSISSLHAPAGAVMLAASSIDSMLKSKGYSSGSLYGRIEEAAKDHLITKDMAMWAHEVRLEANDQRHADDTANLPSTADAQRIIDFALALGQFLFVLPFRVEKGIQQAKGENSNSIKNDPSF